MARLTAHAEVYLSDFDDEDILAEASEIMGRRNLAAANAETPAETICGNLADLAAAISAGRTAEALTLLERFGGTEQRYRDAIDMGARRGRR